MQKIQVYLVPNRILVANDLVGFTTEFRQVYARTLKIYKGIDNKIEIDVRNSDQRKQNVVGKTATLSFYDSDRALVFSATATPITAKPGLLEATIDKDDIAGIDPQFLQMSAKLITGLNESILYIDGQFDLLGQVELLDGYNAKLGAGSVYDELTVFNYEYDRNEFVSEVGRFGKTLNDDNSISIRITRNSLSPFEGNLKIEATKTLSTAFGNTWEQLDPLVIEDDHTDSTTFPLNGAYRFVRFSYPRSPEGAGAAFNIKRENGSYFVTLAAPGSSYTIGDKIRIKGSSLGGVDNTNDLLITVTGINQFPSNSKWGILTFSWSGVAAVGLDNYFNVTPKTTFGKIDKIEILV